MEGVAVLLGDVWYSATFESGCVNSKIKRYVVEMLWSDLGKALNRI